MKWFVNNFASKISKKRLTILDVGSYDVNGTYKLLFDEQRYTYTGLDMETGSNVDIALKNPYQWNEIETDSFDIVISGQALEHIEFFWITMSEMTRVLKKDGLLCVIAPNGFAEHRYPVDCYRFFSDGMIALARYVNLEVLHAHTNCAPTENDTDWYSEKNADSMLVARKPYAGKTGYVDLNTYKCIPVNQEQFRTSLVPYKKGIENKNHQNPLSRCNAITALANTASLIDTLPVGKTECLLGFLSLPLTPTNCSAFVTSLASYAFLDSHGLKQLFSKHPELEAHLAQCLPHYPSQALSRLRRLNRLQGLNLNC